MTRLRHRYQLLSFRGRLLTLLVVVSLIQGGVAAYTFFHLQSRPAEQRVRAQLNASMRGVAPLIDTEIQRSNARLIELVGDPSFQSAARASDWTTVQSLIDTPDGSDSAPSGSSVDSLAGLPTAASDSSDGATTQLGDEPVAEASGDAKDVALDLPTVYVTDRAGKVVAGLRPDAPMLDKPQVTSSRMIEGSDLVATVHVPVVADAAFMKRVKRYAADGVDVFIADDEHVSSTNAPKTGALERPDDLREGLGDVRLGDTDTLALVQPLLGDDAYVGAAMPKAKAAAMGREGLSSFWGFIFLLVVLMIGVAWFITRAVSDALRRFADIARELAGGQLHRRIPVTGDDEIAVLSTSFNDMAENLEQRIEHLIDARAKMRRQVDLFGEALANATAVDEMLTAVCGLAMESTPARHARFWTIDDDGRYEHAACIGLRPGDTEPCGLEKAVPIRNSSLRGDGEPWWLVVPARAHDQSIVGLLTLVSTGDPFSDDDVRVAERIALQAAVAIDNARMHEHLKLQATRDGLTGLPNHRSLQDELTKRVEEAYTAGMPLGVAMLDIDNFKRVNDTYGHPVGDEAIKAIGRTLANGIGGMGMVGRYGGEEFVVIMPGCDAQASCRIADRLREDITGIEIPLEGGGVLKVTSSFGVVNLDQQRPGSRVTPADLMNQADVGLYNAKRTGKNKVMLAGPDTIAIEMGEAEKAKLAARERGDVASEHGATLLDGVGPPPRDPFDLAA